MSAANAAVCTVQVILLNNLWHYISFNEMFDWVAPSRYIGFIIQDLSYVQNGQGFKYPMVFVLMILASLFVAFLWDKTVNFFFGNESVSEGEN